MTKKALYCVAFAALFLACNRLPNDVDLGGSVVLLNGKKVSYEPKFNLVRANQMLGFGFVQTQKSIVNLLGFACPLALTGEFDLFVTDTLRVGARASFSQTVEEDLPGYKYKLADPEEGFFSIEALDTVRQEVRGRFKAKFKRVSKNGWSEDLGLPENLTFEGVFYEKYVVR